jgi:hypothetical protein
MEGRGPDLFLLSAQDMDRTPGGLFEDAEEAVRSGVFCDLLPLFKEAGISEDDFIRPVLDAGKVGGRQYVVPLCYEVLAVLTNDTTRAALGDAAFEDTAAMLRAVRGLTQPPGTGAQSATGFSPDQPLRVPMNPFCLAGPAEDMNATPPGHAARARHPRDGQAGGRTGSAVPTRCARASPG